MTLKLTDKIIDATLVDYLAHVRAVYLADIKRLEIKTLPDAYGVLSSALKNVAIQLDGMAKSMRNFEAIK